MAFDPGLAQLMRDDLAHLPVAEKKMMGGLCFMLAGNMLCGVHKGGAMYRVGKDHHASALAMPGAAPMTFTGKPLSGFVDCDGDLMADDARRNRILDMALSFVQALPPK